MQFLGPGLHPLHVAEAQCFMKRWVGSSVVVSRVE